MKFQIKSHQIPVTFETKNQLFQFFITFQCHQKKLLSTFLADILYTINNRSLSKCRFGEVSRELSKVWNFALMGSFGPNYIKFQLKEHMTNDAKFKEKMTFDFKYNLSNFVNFHPTTQKSENFFSMGSFCLKYTRWCKIWINPHLVVSKITWGIGWTFIGALKSLKNCTWMGYFCPKHIMLQPENFTEIMCHDTEEWCKIWRKTDSRLEKWQNEFG